LKIVLFYFELQNKFPGKIKNNGVTKEKQSPFWYYEIL
jgi:hypothetical protein